MHEKLKATAVRFTLVTGVAAAALGAHVGVASANTNFNGSCETSEFCGYRTQAGDSGMYDYENTDRTFADNYFSGTSVNVNENISYIRNRGTVCRSVMWEDTNLTGAWAVWLFPGGDSGNLTGTGYDNKGSSLSWDCSA